jgi:hypothetical protein
LVQQLSQRHAHSPRWGLGLLTPDGRLFRRDLTADRARRHVLLDTHLGESTPDGGECPCSVRDEGRRTSRHGSGGATPGRAHPPWRWLMLLGSPPAVAALPDSCQSIPRSGVAAERWLAMSPTMRRQPPVSRETRRGARRTKYAGDGLMRQAPPACRRRGPVGPPDRRSATSTHYTDEGATR